MGDEPNAEFLREYRMRWEVARDHRDIALLDEMAPAHAYLILERLFNNGSPSGFNRTVSDEYAPNAAGAFYRLRVCQVPASLCTVVGDLEFSSTDTHGEVGLPEYRAVPIHPDVHADYPVSLSQRVVSPTASGRTVAALNKSGVPGWLKLHYPQTLGRNLRDLYHFKWLSALELSVLLEPQIPDFRRQGFEVMLERSGCFVDSDTSRGWGVAVRHNPFYGEETLLVPVFSALFRDEKGKWPVLAWMLRRLGTESPLEDLLIPLIESYFVLALEHGMLPECNAQNVLWAIAGTDTTVVHRDLGDFFKDLDVRSARGLSTSFVRYKIIDQDSEDLIQRRSFSFDFKLGTYVVEPLVEGLSKVCSINKAALLRRVREYTGDRLSAYPDYFGGRRSWYSYPSRPIEHRMSYVENDNPPLRPC